MHEKGLEWWQPSNSMMYLIKPSSQFTLSFPHGKVMCSCEMVRETRKHWQCSVKHKGAMRANPEKWKQNILCRLDWHLCQPCYQFTKILTNILSTGTSQWKIQFHHLSSFSYKTLDSHSLPTKAVLTHRKTSLLSRYSFQSWHEQLAMIYTMPFWNNKSSNPAIVRVQLWKHTTILFQHDCPTWWVLELSYI